MSFIERLSTTQKDVLREIGNIGAGHSATALSQLLNKKIDMNVPDVRIVTFNDMMDMVGGADNVVSSVFLRLEGDAPGSMFFILSLAQAQSFVHQMTNDTSFSFDNQPYPELAMSALQELGNILSGSYLSSLSDFTKLNLYPSVPALAIDMVGAILGYGLIEISHVSDYAIVIDTTIIEVDNPRSAEVEGHFFLLPDPDSFDIIFSALGVRHDE